MFSPRDFTPGPSRRHREAVRIGPLGLLPVTLLLVAGCATQEGARGSAAAGPASYVWEVRAEGEAAPVYLAGSVHVAPKEGLTFPASLDSAFEAAEVLMVEVDAQGKGAAEAQRLLFELGTYPAGEPGLFERLSDETRVALEEALEATYSQLPRANISRFRPWALSLMFMSLQLAEAGIDGTGGVEMVLLDRIRKGDASDKEVAELESIEQQLRLFAGFSPEVQDLLLRAQLEDGVDGLDEIRGLMRAWEEGDDETLIASITDSLDEPEMRPVYDALILDRNETMARDIAALARNASKRHLVVVGVGHLLGPESVVDKLRDDRLTVRRLPADEQVPHTQE